MAAMAGSFLTRDCAGCARRPAQRKPAVRCAPQTIQDLQTCLRGYPPYVKVEVKRDVPVVAKTVGDLPWALQRRQRMRRGIYQRG